MTLFINKYRYLSLVLLAVLCGLLWRWELEYHGWAYLNWITYFHWAIPASFALFLIWANAFVTLTTKARILINLGAIGYGILIYYLVYISLVTAHSRGSILLSNDISTFTFALIIIGQLLIVPTIPVCIFLVLKKIKQAPKPSYLIMSIVGVVLSAPIAEWLLAYTNHIGSDDFIHTIKSGYLMALLTFSFGLVFMGIRHKKEQELAAYQAKIDSISR